MIDDRDWDDDDDREPDPEEFADESCIVCGGQGGWCGSFTADGQCVWVLCDCIEWGEWAEAVG